ncbi:MAG: sulfatase [Opitutales bacterium]
MERSISLIIVLALIGLVGDAQAQETTRPNIVLLIADDLGAGDIGAVGHPTIQTPNLDRLVAGGVHFQRAFATSSSCSPSRASIFTGRWPHATGAEDLHVPLPTEQRILPEMLREAGYHTMHAGKLHLGEKQAARFDASHAEGDAHYSSGIVDTSADSWLNLLAERPMDRPFFLSIGYSDPHRPYHEGVIEPPTDPADVIVPPYLADTPLTRSELALYYDYARRMDGNVGLVLDWLKQEDLTDETIVLFMSDNGIPFPRAKTTCYDSGLRVPLVISWPGTLPANQTTDALASLADVVPTLLGLVGLEIPDSVQGVDQGGILRNPAGPAVREYVFAERNWHNWDDHQRAVRDTRYKYISNAFPNEPAVPASDLLNSVAYAELLRLRDLGSLTSAQMRLFMVPRPGEELYDLSRDPWEFVNLANDPAFADVKERMRDALERWTVDDVSPEKRYHHNVNFYTGEKHGKQSGPPEQWNP